MKPWVSVVLRPNHETIAWWKSREGCFRENGGRAAIGFAPLTAPIVKRQGRARSYSSINKLRAAVIAVNDGDPRYAKIIGGL